MQVTQVVLDCLRAATVIWRTARRLRRAALLAGLAGVCAWAAVLTAASALAVAGTHPAERCPAGSCTQIGGTEPISVTVPPHPAGGVPGGPPAGGGPGAPPAGGGPAAPGSLTFTVTGGTATLTGSVHPLVLGGDLPAMTVTDTRNSRPGWSVWGQVSDFAGSGTAVGSVISGNQLGWTPVGAVTGGARLGSPVDPASPGLGSIAAKLAWAGAGAGFGTDTVSAKLLLDIPATAPAGPYTVTLTITCVESTP